ncbi:MAG: hypothetical protein RIC16_03480 [Rhodospirillales bacterium]
MTRVSDASTINALINNMLRTQERRTATNFQVVSGKVSQDYAGISFQSQRLVSLETSRDLNLKYMQNNQTQELRLSVMETSLTSIRQSVQDARETVVNFASRDAFDEGSVTELQTFAFNTLKNIEAFLNVDVDGQYLFSGSRVNTEPIDLGLTSISDFQNKYDGAINRYATTRDAHLSELTVSEDTTLLDANHINTDNFLIFRQDDDADTTDGGRSSIEANSALFSNYKVGSLISVSGTANNNGDYRIDEISSDGTKIYVSTEMFTDETLPRRLFDQASVSTGVIELPDGTQLTNTDTGNLALDRDAGTITALTDGSFDSVDVDDVIQLSGTNTSNGSFTVTGKSTVNTQLTDEASVAADLSFLSGLNLPAETVTFNQAGRTITAGAGTPFATVSAGDVITISGTANNDQQVVVESVGGGGASITIAAQTEILTVASSQTLTIGDNDALTSDDTSRMVFSRSGDTITVDQAGTFTEFDVGQKIVVDGTARNDGTYTIESVSDDGTTVTISSSKLTDEGLSSGTTFFDYTVGTSLVINDTNETIQAVDLDGNADTEVFRNVQPGDFFRLSGTAGGTQDGIFQVLTVDSSTGTITLDTSPDAIRQDTVTIDTPVTIEAGDVYSVTIDGTTVSYTTTGGEADETDIRNGLVSAINNNSTLNRFVIASNGGSNAELEISYATTSTTSHSISVTATNGGASNDNALSVATAVDGSASTVFTANETVTAESLMNFDDRDIELQLGNEITFTGTTMALSGITGGTALADVFDNLRAGMQFTLTGTANAGTYTIGSVSSDGSTITLASGETFGSPGTFTPSANNTASIEIFGADGTISASQSYYQGDSVELTHRVDANRSIDIDVNATHPAFEKAIRALSILLQGEFGTEGGLDNNQERIDQAMYLLDDALSSPAEGTPPFGQELNQDFDEIEFELGFKQIVLNDARAAQEDYNNIVANFITDIEDVDQLDAINRLLADQRALEASYQAMSRVMSFNLVDFL